MNVVVLASGSKGNATYIETASTRLLIDAGISYRQIALRLRARGLEASRLDAVLLTHEHSDHINGLPTVLKTTGATLYSAEATCRHLFESTLLDGGVKSIAIESDVPFQLGDLTITPLDVSHDAAAALGFVIEHEGKRLVYLTDVGFLPTSDYPKIAGAEAYLFEANYDVSLLFSSPRPYYLKRRIDSVKGHMSNADSAYHLSKLVGDNTHTIVLVHPSEECNTEHHALGTLLDVFESYDVPAARFDIIVAAQHEPTKLIRI